MDNLSHVRYLLVLNRLHKSDGIRSIDVAREMEVTKTSVHNMMDTFVSLNYIRKERGGLIYLTRLGIQKARRYQKQYDLVRKSLFPGCITDGSVEKAICALIADLSETACKLLMREQAAS